MVYLIALNTFKISPREGDDRRSHPGPLRENVTICITPTCTTPTTACNITPVAWSFHCQEYFVVQLLKQARVRVLSKGTLNALTNTSLESRSMLTASHRTTESLLSEMGSTVMPGLR